MFCEQSDVYQVDTIGMEYLDGLYSYALVLSRNQADADDLVQQTYVRAMQAMGRRRADSNIKSWFFTILHNIWLKQLRKRPSEPQILDTDMDGGFANEMVVPPISSYKPYVSKVEREQVRAAIQKLPVDFREVIVLREYEEFSYQEIASIVGCPAETVMSRLERARSKLRVLLSDINEVQVIPKEKQNSSYPLLATAGEVSQAKPVARRIGDVNGTGTLNRSGIIKVPVPSGPRNS